MVVISNKQNKKACNRLLQKKRRQWNVRKKLMVIHYFENNKRNVRGTSKKFDTQPKQVCDWVKKRSIISRCSLCGKTSSGKTSQISKIRR